LGRSRFRIDSQPRCHAIATIFFNDVESVRKATRYCRAPLEAFMQRFGAVVEKKLQGYDPSDKRADLSITREKGLGMLWFDIGPVQWRTYAPMSQQKPSVRMDPFVNRSLRAEDFTVKYGEDEFLTYTFGCTSDEIMVIGRRICDAVQSAYVDDKTLRRTVSMGTSHSSEITGGIGSAGIVYKLMGITEQRLYQAKRQNDGTGKIVGSNRQDFATRAAGYLSGSVIVAGEGRYITAESLRRLGSGNRRQ
jgi:hypothetical protein